MPFLFFCITGFRYQNQSQQELQSFRLLPHEEPESNGCIIGPHPHEEDREEDLGGPEGLGGLPPQLELFWLQLLHNSNNTMIKQQFI